MIMGLIFGSFATALSHRLPRSESIATAHSRCPSCKTALGVRDLLPVFSWLMSAGKCRHCGVAVSWRYPAIELAMAAAFALVTWRYGLGWNAALLWALGFGVIVLSVVDFEHFLIPDQAQLGLLALGLLYRWQGGGWEEAGIGAALGLALGAGLRWGYRFLRKKEGLGMGDVKFLAVAGLWLPLMGWVPFLLIGGLLGVGTALWWRRKGWGAVFPFGPALAVSLWIVVVFPEASHWQYYLS